VYDTCVATGPEGAVGDTGFQGAQGVPGRFRIGLSL